VVVALANAADFDNDDAAIRLGDRELSKFAG
jgi:hypothetical protein